MADNAIGLIDRRGGLPGRRCRVAGFAADGSRPVCSGYLHAGWE